METENLKNDGWQLADESIAIIGVDEIWEKRDWRVTLTDRPDYILVSLVDSKTWKGKQIKIYDKTWVLETVRHLERLEGNNEV